MLTSPFGFIKQLPPGLRGRVTPRLGDPAAIDRRTCRLSLSCMKLTALFFIAFASLAGFAQGTKTSSTEQHAEIQAKAEHDGFPSDWGDIPIPDHLVEAFAKAEKGDAEAQFGLGLAYQWGIGVPKLPKEAVKWYRLAAEQRNVLAQSFLAGMYAKGEGVERDPKEAVKWLRMAAEQGFFESQYNLGLSYSRGEGVDKDPKEAVKWFRLAAEQGVAEAQFSLGLRYSRGEGVDKDPKEAVKWFRMAAEQGDAGAQFNLGVMFNNGVGVLKDESEALAWFGVSAISGHEKAIENRGILEHRLGPQATLLAQQRSKEILKQIEANQARTREGTTTHSPMAVDSGSTPKFSGSGIIVSSSGHVLTAAHVVAGAERITVVTAEGSTAAAVVRVDEFNDLAVLKLSGGPYSALPVAPSRPIRLGQTVATIGFPNIGIQGFSPKVTRGEISSLNGAGDDPRSWQISAPVQAGNSGGPLLDENGNLVGVVQAKLGLKAAAATGDLPQNVGYAVKSAYVLPLLEPFLDGSAPEPHQPSSKPSFEDMVAKARDSVVLILVY